MKEIIIFVVLILLILNYTISVALFQSENYFNGDFSNVNIFDKIMLTFPFMTLLYIIYCLIMFLLTPIKSLFVYIIRIWRGE